MSLSMEKSKWVLSISAISIGVLFVWLFDNFALRFDGYLPIFGVFLYLGIGIAGWGTLALFYLISRITKGFIFETFLVVIGSLSIWTSIKYSWEMSDFLKTFSFCGGIALILMVLIITILKIQERSAN